MDKVNILKVNKEKILYGITISSKDKNRMFNVREKAEKVINLV